ncbi:DUF5107 domain-containing protein [Amycolatopsis sp. CA-230715]|uniref:DUF5107 domain-containing protein n=1 Tax=Amycolatopsis sp. CA-230715 TaxID=2745196 RepID=UPI001C027DBD|nr:DUF5107 domain-containing protein [Amycolatopsis sp. CA-230715]QWF78326.1 hypothetical protein HUW46_01721 [Amycolatopsis sp. CA-230715]
MTRLYRTEIRLPCADLGEENPLPPLEMLDKAQRVTNLDELPADLASNVEYGTLRSVLPCLLQDSYDRDRRERALPALVLENDHVTATVLPTLGGRLFSLYHKGEERELLYRNPVFQPANLALRGAWFAGGVEWNLGSTGHTTLTCEPMHASRVDGPDGTPVLRLWEWERTRDLPYQVDFWLPEDSEFVYVGVRIRNPHPRDVPAYWWSNIAVTRTERTRVLAPATQAWHYGYGGRLDLVDVPGESDLTYPARHEQAADFFFEVPDDRPRWIAAVEADGRGLAQLSTRRLRGRKLFVWGESDGGHRWQEWLAPGAPGYLEIQAGLARTQLEHLRLPGGQAWDWLEAYGPIRTDGAHGDWATAVRAAEDSLPFADLDERHAQWLAVADREPAEILHRGSGWGALEAARSSGPALPGTPFTSDTLGAAQAPWLALLDGAMGGADPLSAPAGTLVSEPWRALLEKAGESWEVWYHRGVARWYAEDRAGAVEAWRASVDASPNPWALRNLAVAGESPAELLAEAHHMAPDVRPLAIEAITAALDDPPSALALIEGLSEELRAYGRIKLLEARARLALGDRAGASRIFTDGFDLPDVREGETSLSDTWHALAGDEPLPARYDFRMKK